MTIQIRPVEAVVDDSEVIDVPVLVLSFVLEGIVNFGDNAKLWGTIHMPGDRRHGKPWNCILAGTKGPYPEIAKTVRSQFEEEQPQKGQLLTVGYKDEAFAYAKIEGTSKSKWMHIAAIYSLISVQEHQGEMQEWSFGGQQDAEDSQPEDTEGAAPVPPALTRTK